MAANTSPIFLAVPKIGAVSVSTANTARDGSGTIATVFTAGSFGSKINEVVIKAEADPADSTVVFFLYDGSTYHVFDEWDIGNPAAGATTTVSYRESRTYDNLLLPSGWSLRASITVALTSGVLRVVALGGDY